jgi:two-component sensor histidine kinase
MAIASTLSDLAVPPLRAMLHTLRSTAVPQSTQSRRMQAMLRNCQHRAQAMMGAQRMLLQEQTTATTSHLSACRLHMVVQRMRQIKRVL